MPNFVGGERAVVILVCFISAVIFVLALAFYFLSRAIRICTDRECPGCNDFSHDAKALMTGSGVMFLASAGALVS